MHTLIEWYNNETPVLITIIIGGAVISNQIIIDTFIDYGDTIIIGNDQFTMELETDLLVSEKENRLSYSEYIYLTSE